MLTLGWLCGRDGEDKNAQVSTDFVDLKWEKLTWRPDKQWESKINVPQGDGLYIWEVDGQFRMFVEAVLNTRNAVRLCQLYWCELSTAN